MYIIADSFHNEQVTTFRYHKYTKSYNGLSNTRAIYYKEWAFSNINANIILVEHHSRIDSYR
jgi:hypothetical protein